MIKIREAILEELVRQSEEDGQYAPFLFNYDIYGPDSIGIDGTVNLMKIAEAVERALSK